MVICIAGFHYFADFYFLSEKNIATQESVYIYFFYQFNFYKQIQHDFIFSIWKVACIHDSWGSWFQMKEEKREFRNMTVNLEPQ